jgi:hypothetical protein
MSQLFRIHGDFKCHIDGQVVVTEVTGPWNKELVEAWSAFMYPIALELSAKGPYMGIAVIRGSMLCPPDALESLRRAVQYASKHLQCVCNVIVAARDVEGRGFIEPNFVQIYGDTIPYKFFYDIDEAMAWSKEQLRLQGN